MCQNEARKEIRKRKEFSVPIKASPVSYDTQELTECLYWLLMTTAQRFHAVHLSTISSYKLKLIPFFLFSLPRIILEVIQIYFTHVVLGLWGFH